MVKQRLDFVNKNLFGGRKYSVKTRQHLLSQQFRNFFNDKPSKKTDHFSFVSFLFFLQVNQANSGLANIG